MNHKYTRFLTPAALVCALAAHAAEVYKWTGPDGGIMYSDAPPENAESKRLDAEIPFIDEPPIVKWRDPSKTEARQPSGLDQSVIIYTTEWCGVCRQATQYFQTRDIRYVEYDVETSDRGLQNYRQLRGKGVPIILVGEQRMDGFSETAFERLLTGAR